MLTVLLCATVALPAALRASADRQNNRYPVGPDVVAVHPISGSPLPAYQLDAVYNHRHVSIVEMAARPGAVPPPGVHSLPAPGSSVVSPALRRLLKHADARSALARAVPNPEAQIADIGLSTPDELFAYVGTTPDDIQSGPTSSEIAGWGLARQQLFRADISPFVAVPIAALLLLPVSGLLAMVLRLDAGRRKARAATLQAIGAGRWHRALVDIGFVGPPLLAGWAIGAVVRPWADSVFANQILGGRVFFGSDLDGPPFALLIVLLLLVSVCVSTFFRNVNAEQVTRNVMGTRTVEGRVRAIAGCSSLCLGVAGTVIVVKSGVDSPWRNTPAPLVAAPCLLLLGAILVAGPATTFVTRMSATRSLVGDLAHSALRASRATWRTGTAGLLVGGAIAGVGIATLSVLDGSSTTDQLIWQPNRLSADYAFASVSPARLTPIAVNTLDGYTAAIAPAGPVNVTSGSRQRTLNGVYVDCRGLSVLIDVPDGTLPCESAWVVDDRLNPHTGNVRISDASGQEVQRSITTTHTIAPAALIGGTETIVIPVDGTGIVRALQSHPAPAGTYAVFRISGDKELQALRMKLWDPTVVPLNGSQSPFGLVLSKQDWLVDSRHYTDTYSALLFGLLIASSAGAAINVALAGATQIDESTHRFRVLSALGTRTTTLRRAQALASLCPPAVSTIIGWLLGSGLGFAYVALCNSSNSGARPTAFPIDRFLEFAQPTRCSCA
jgi:hypothetical protein